MSPRKLRDDERALWQQVAGSTTPLPDALRRDAEPQKTPLPQIKSSKSQSIPAFEIGDLAPEKRQRMTLPSAPTANKPMMDNKTFGKMKRGKLVPEARIDLHGMTVDQAHPSLTRFILTSHSRGLRLVLVITGKGDRDDPYQAIPHRRGVLKRQVPTWLRMAPLGPLVLDVTEAHTRHGGGGAYYVYLRRTGRG